jgi:hypothetical protein
MVVISLGGAVAGWKLQVWEMVRDTAAVRKKRAIWIAVGVIALVTVWFVFLRPRDEPKYQGRYLSEWVADYKAIDAGIRASSAYSEFDPKQVALAKAAHAVRTIGTNGLAHFLKWVRATQPVWQRDLRFRLPYWLENIKSVRDWLGDAAKRRAAYGWCGICLLGTNAAGAIPTLEVMVKDRANHESSLIAIHALNFIGTASIPALQSAFADTNTPNRPDMTYSFYWMAFELGHTNTTLPILTAALHDHDPKVRVEAKRWLDSIRERWLDERSLTNAPTK